MYAQLDTSTPGLTAHALGCVCGPGHCGCGMGAQFTQRRIHLGGLGDDGDSAIDDSEWASETTDPANSISPLSPGNGFDPSTMPDLPLPSASDIGTGLTSDYPSTIGNEFVLVGPNQYLNIQTNQIVPMNVAQLVTGASTASGATLQTTGTESGVSLKDPVTGTVYNGPLTAVAQALNATGQLVTAAGNLTAQGRALAASGQLVTAPTSSLSASLSSISSWFSSSTLLTGIPNWQVLGGTAAAIAFVSYLYRESSFQPPKRRRAR